MRDKFKAKYLLCCLLALCLALATACSATPGPQPGTGDTVTDLLGNEVRIPEKVEKIVSLTPADLEILFALGLGEKVIGRVSYSNYPEQAADIPEMGDYSGPNVEAIIAADADIVFTGNNIQQDSVDMLVQAGCTVICAEATAYDQILEAVMLIGSAAGVEDAAQKLAGEIEKRAEAVKKAAAALDTHPTAYYVMSYGDQGNWTSGKGSFINDIITMAGGLCVTDDTDTAWIEYSMETLLEKDPDIIFLSSYYTVEALSAEAGYSDLKAVKEGRVYILDVNTVERPGPRVADALEDILAVTSAFAG